MCLVCKCGLHCTIPVIYAVHKFCQVKKLRLAAILHDENE